MSNKARQHRDTRLSVRSQQDERLHNSASSRSGIRCRVPDDPIKVNA